MTIVHIKYPKDSRELISNPETQTADLQYHAPGNALKLGYRGCASAATSKGAGCEKGNCCNKQILVEMRWQKRAATKIRSMIGPVFFGVWDGYSYFMMTNGLEFQTWNLKVPMIQSFFFKLTMCWWLHVGNRQESLSSKGFYWKKNAQND